MARRKRGDLRHAVLSLLGERAHYGYELLREFPRNGLGAVSPGSIYPLLSHLESLGLLHSSRNRGRRIYEITPAGREQLSDASTAEGRMAGYGAEHEALRRSTLRLLAAVSQIDIHTSSSTIARTRHVLDSARREIYSLLLSE